MDSTSVVIDEDEPIGIRKLRRKLEALEVKSDELQKENMALVKELQAVRKVREAEAEKKVLDELVLENERLKKIKAELIALKEQRELVADTQERSRRNPRLSRENALVFQLQQLAMSQRVMSGPEIDQGIQYIFQHDHCLLNPEDDDDSDSWETMSDSEDDEENGSSDGSVTSGARDVDGPLTSGDTVDAQSQPPTLPIHPAQELMSNFVCAVKEELRDEPEEEGQWVKDMSTRMVHKTCFDDEEEVVLTQDIEDIERLVSEIYANKVTVENEKGTTEEEE